MPAPASPVNRTALALYRELYRHTRALPRDSLDYYRNYLRSAFVNFSSEADPERLAEVMRRGRDDAQWILKKASHVHWPTDAAAS